MASTRDRYVIAELDGTGHRLWYVSLILRYLANSASNSDICLVTTRTAQSLPEWHEFIADGPWSGRLKIVWVENIRASIQTIAVLMQNPRTRLVITDGDRWLQALLEAGIRGGFRPKGTLLIIRPIRSHGVRGSIRHFGKIALMKSLKRFSPNLSLLKLAPSGTPISKRGWVHDPVEFNPWATDRATWLAGHNLTADRRYLVVLGDLTSRKYVPELLEAFSSGYVGHWHLILVGTLGLKEHQLVTRGLAAARYSVFEGFATDRDFDTWIARSDAVAILHRNQGASGILGKCSAAGTPILVGGATSVLDAARMTRIPRWELSQVQASSITEALQHLPSRRVSPATIDVRTDSESFVARLLGN